MLEEWLIDGYNLLHDAAAPGGRAKLSREALFDLLAGFASAASRKVLLVLDGHGNHEEFRAYRNPSFEILYSQSETADSVIERLLCEKKGTHAFMVVTKDRAVSQMARGSGSRVMKPAEFMRLLSDRGKENEELLFREKVKSHGFNRPFESKLNEFKK